MESVSATIPAGYKQTEVGVIPEDWNIENLNVIADVIDPHPSHRAPPVYANGVPFLGIGDMDENGKVIGKKIRMVSPLIFDEHRQRYDLNQRLIGLGRVASIGKVISLIEPVPPYTISPTIGIIQSKEIDRDYLLFALDSELTKSQFSKVLSGSTRSSIGMDVLREIQIVYPESRKEQHDIANLLIDIGVKIQILQNLISKKRDIKQGTMQELLTGKTRLPGFSGEWDIRRLGDFSTVIMGQSPSSSSYNDRGIGLPLIQGNADVKKRRAIIRNYTSQITKEAKKGDIIMSVRAPVGEIALTSFDACIGRGVCAIRYPNKFLFHLLILGESNWSKFSGGSTFESINSNEIQNATFLIPPTNEEQVGIADVLSDMDAEITALEQRLEKAKAIKQGMMQQLLTGRIRLVDPSTPVEVSA